MMRFLCFAVFCLFIPLVVSAEDETFVTIQKVSGNRIEIVKDTGGGGRGRCGGGGGGFGRRGGRFGQAAKEQRAVLTIPATVKITSAMRERRTSEFRVGVELAGGLRNQLFRNMQAPLQARIVTNGNQILEINVITSDTDINQTNSDEGNGGTVIAVKPKRPPMKRGAK